MIALLIIFAVLCAASSLAAFTISIICSSSIGENDILGIKSSYWLAFLLLSFVSTMVTGHLWFIFQSLV